MKKTLIAIALATISVTSYAQSNIAPAAATQAQNTIAPVSDASLKTGASGVNPYTGVTKESERVQKELDSLKVQKDLSSSKLQLERDDLERLRLEVEKKKLNISITPPPPEHVKTPVPVKVKPTTHVITPTSSKNEQPTLVGIVSVENQKVALIEYDGQPLRATVGSIVAGKTVEEISTNNIKLGGMYLQVSAKRGYPTVTNAEGESDGPVKRRRMLGGFGMMGSYNQYNQYNPSGMPQQQMPQAVPSIPGTNIPTSSTAQNPFNNLLPPPPVK